MHYSANKSKDRLSKISQIFRVQSLAQKKRELKKKTIESVHHNDSYPHSASLVTFLSCKELFKVQMNQIENGLQEGRKS